MAVGHSILSIAYHILKEKQPYRELGADFLDKQNTDDAIIRNVSRDESGLCLFSRCLGQYLAVGPDGDLYPCNRFAGNRDYSLGWIQDVNAADELFRAPGWQRVADWFIDSCRMNA